MKDLNTLDPLPKFKGNVILWLGGGLEIRLPESERAKREWEQHCEKMDGEDWKPYYRDGHRIEHMFINGQGKLKHEPPEPEADIVVVIEAGYSEVFWPNGVPREDWLDTFAKDVHTVAEEKHWQGEHRWKLSALRPVYAGRS